MSFAIAITLCIVYALWLMVVAACYVFYPTKKWKTNNKGNAVETLKFEMMTSRNGSLSCRKGSCTSELTTSTRGPQPLTKNIISEEKMVQLRKKSMDFVEAQKHMKELNEELGLKHQLTRDLEEDEGFKVRMERKDSKEFASSDDLDDSRAPLHQSSPELDDPFPSLDRSQLKRPSTSDEDDDDDDDNIKYLERKIHSSSSINRSTTFNYGMRHGAAAGIHNENADSDNGSEKGGSLRITRHSKRARGKLEHIFKKPGLETVTSPTSPPSFNITPSTPPFNHAMMNYSPPSESTDSTNAEANVSAPIQTQELPPPALQQSTSPSQRSPGQRRRRAGYVPPMITTTPDEQGTGQQQAQSCPFHKSLAAPQKSSSPRPCRRGVSPGGSSVGENGASPRPVRKKKVSVAQIEATIVPPTPIALEPPPHHMARSPSFNVTRTHHDAFADNAFRSVMQISQDAICCANSVGDIVFWSVGASKMFGYTPGEAIGSSLEVCI